ncbi:MAG TPA: ATP-binding protein, partial [Thermodesulfovibrionales bacterium]|nr:ATP-binding protein [Thermodesulfovibrionales bacterium]
RLDDKADEFIFFMQDSVKRMDRLIKELVDFSRLRTGVKRLQPVNFSIPLEGALLGLHSAINESGAEITFDALPTIEADELQITRLFQNLISNSIKFRGKEKPRIHISADKKDGEWVFSVRDNGIGIEPKFFQRIFQVFQRLHTTLEYEGTGMGLTMSKKIVELHKGKIWVESEPGKGATFFFSIPEHHS